MKKRILLGLFTVLAMFGLASCKEDKPTPPGPVVTTTYDVTFEANGHGTTPEKVTEVSKLPTLPTLTEDGWTFEGWFYDKGCNDKANVGDEIEKNITLYAKWTEKKPEIETITIAQALEICAGLTNEDTNRYIIEAVVEKIENPSYGQMIIKDATGSIEVYGSYDADGVKGYATLEDKPYAGDKVRISALLQNFNGKYEVKSAWILSFEHVEEEFNINDYEAMTIATARDAKKDKKVLLEGIVAKISYANGKIPSGFYLVDQSSSIYVYDDQIAPRVKIGNKIKIAAIKDYWILDNEVNHAAKFDYEGCCQVAKVKLIENDGKTNNAYDKSWIEETTIKKIMDTPFSENITTKIYKVNALVKKSVGEDFINYYFNDIDGITGTYTYTQCNGSDFDWLDEFDGKICTVYLSVINAKSSDTGCNWRFFPIEVIDEGYEFNVEDAPKFAIDYFVNDLFLDSYTNDPELVLPKKATSEVLDLGIIKITYSSLNPDVIRFEEKDDCFIMHTNAYGKTTITVKASYLTYTYEHEIEVEYVEFVLPDYLSVKEAIDLAPAQGEKVVVRGIVGPSLVNQKGFYLIDETGIIAVKMDDAKLKNVSFGDEVILQGIRTINNIDKATEALYGQSIINDAIVLVNLYGNNKYSNSSFDNSAKLEELLDFSVAEDHTTQVYVLDVVVEWVEGRYSTINLKSTTDPSKSIQLYAGSAEQYNWLNKYDGQKITVEIALCNWNFKAQFKGCILSATNSEGETEYNLLNFK